ncbi:MAG: tRNA adenosine(34) deaminase TadA [Bdellovibrionaceae bacterium]|nr:tRNA adenosine(34) deaminase TadA [Pseudobdellovibrionaceae bacterium]
MSSETNGVSRQDEFWMRKALELARKAGERDEVPIGALLIGSDGTTILSRAMNRKEEWMTPLGHAELIALHRASQKKRAWRLTGSTLYVTLEPCVMCAGALWQARVSRVVYGASDPKGGGVKSLYQILEDPRLNHRCEVVGGVLASECGLLLSNYFREKRKK